MNLNKVIIIGKLNKDPEAHFAKTGISLTRLSVATSSFKRDENGNREENIEYHDVLLWGRKAEDAANYLVRGQIVYIEGKLETRAWESKDGIKRYRSEIVLDNTGGQILFGAKPKS